jgi:predicted MFS family arabinose efflux permease
MLRQIQEGLRYVWSHRLIRTLSLFTLVGNIGGSAAGALVLYRLNHDLHASSFWSGVAMSGVSVGSLLGSLLSSAINRKVAMGRIMSAALLMGSIPDFIAAFVPHPAAIAASNVLLGIAMVLWNVQSMSLRQSVIPDHLLGRASSSIRLIVWGSLPVGSTLGGAAGQWFGAPAVFTVTGLLHLAVWLVGWRTPLYRAQRPQPQEAAGHTMASG